MAEGRDLGVPLAIATFIGLLAALVVLLLGTVSGSRAWIVLIRAAITFMLVSGILKFLTAGVIQASRWKATKEEDTAPVDESDEVHETAETIRNDSPETMEKVPS